VSKLILQKYILMSILYYLGNPIDSVHRFTVNHEAMKTVLFVLFLAPIFGFGQYKLLSTEGQYQGSNLYINNPKQMDGFGYCIIKVTVNGDVLPASIQSTNFVVDFGLFDLNLGDDIFVVIEHFDGCTPRFLNPEVLLPKSTFEVIDLSINKDGILNWTTKNEGGILDFSIEKFKWNSWVGVGQIRGKGGKELNSYSYKVSLHSGENKIRVIQVDNSGDKRVSQPISYESDIAEFTMAPSSVKDYIYFYSDSKHKRTRYEVFDAFGNLLKVGFSDRVDCRNIVNGIYYVNYDNRTEKFIKVN